MSIPTRVASVSLLAILLACSDSNDSYVAPLPPPVLPDFSAVDTRLGQFVSENDAFDGASIVIVDRQSGVIHRQAFGDHTLETIVLLASTSKMPSVSLLMALEDDDENVDFDIAALIDDYLPYQGFWTGRTTEQLVSNTAGIPGLQYVVGYGLHLCQYAAQVQLQACGQLIYQTPLPDLPSSPPGENFDYGGSQWQLAGAVAEVVGGASWAQLFDAYIAEPCGLEVFEYGNQFSSLTSWTGTADSLIGRENPNVEGGAISNLDDYAKLLQMHLNEGRCGDIQVLDPESVSFMRRDRGTPAGSADDLTGWGYGMGWWVIPAAGEQAEPYLYVDPGAFGSISWIDISRDYGAYVALEDYGFSDAAEGTAMVIEELIPLVEAAIDAVAP